MRRASVQVPPSGHRRCRTALPPSSSDAGAGAWSRSGRLAAWEDPSGIVGRSLRRSGGKIISRTLSPRRSDCQTECLRSVRSWRGVVGAGPSIQLEYRLDPYEPLAYAGEALVRFHENPLDIGDGLIKDSQAAENGSQRQAGEPLEPSKLVSADEVVGGVARCRITPSANPTCGLPTSSDVRGQGPRADPAARPQAPRALAGSNGRRSRSEMRTSTIEPPSSHGRSPSTVPSS